MFDAKPAKIHLIQMVRKYQRREISSNVQKDPWVSARGHLRRNTEHLTLDGKKGDALVELFKRNTIFLTFAVMLWGRW